MDTLIAIFFAIPIVTLIVAVVLWVRDTAKGY
jgi:hypothetical protein